MKKLFSDEYTEADVEFAYRTVVAGLVIFAIMVMISSNMGIYLW